MPVKPNGDVYFNITVYREAGSDSWVADAIVSNVEEHYGHLVDLCVDGGYGTTPGEALEDLAVTDLTDEAIEQIKGAVSAE